MMIFQHYDDADHQDHHLSPPSASFDISGNEAQDVCVSHQNCLVDLGFSEPTCLESGYVFMIALKKIMMMIKP